MLHWTWLERLESDKHCSLLGPFISYEEKVVCEYRGKYLNVTLLPCPAFCHPGANAKKLDAAAK
jgi:hypothetical protein